MRWFNFRSNTKLSSEQNETKNPCVEKCYNSSNNPRNIMLKYPESLSAFFGGLNLISNSLAIMKWNFKTIEDESLPTTHYLWHLFDNSELTRFNIVKNLIHDIIIYGNGILYIERDKQTYKPKTLHYCRPDSTKIYYNPIYDKVWYWNWLYSNGWESGENYLHFYMNSTNGFVGDSIPFYAFSSLQTYGNTERAVNNYYASNGVPHAVVSPGQNTPMVGMMDDRMKELKANWDRAMEQTNGSGTVFCPADIKYTQLSGNAKDSALIDARLFNITEVARWLNISPTLLGDLSHNSYGTISESQKEFIIHTLSPYVIMFENELNRKLIMPSRMDREHIDLDEDSILATDQEKQANYYKSLTSSGIMTINEARHKLGLPPKDGADDLIIPYSDVNANKVDSESPESTQNDTNKNDETK